MWLTQPASVTRFTNKVMYLVFPVRQQESEEPKGTFAQKKNLLYMCGSFEGMYVWEECVAWIFYIYAHACSTQLITNHYRHFLVYTCRTWLNCVSSCHMMRAQLASTLSNSSFNICFFSCFSFVTSYVSYLTFMRAYHVSLRTLGLSELI